MISLIIIGVLLLIFMSAALAPMESLGWWAGWDGKRPDKGQRKLELAEAEKAAEGIPEADFYLVYLSGIGAISGTSIPDEEHPFINGLKNQLPGGESDHRHLSLFGHQQRFDRAARLFCDLALDRETAAEESQQPVVPDGQHAQRLPSVRFLRPALRPHLQPGDLQRDRARACSATAIDSTAASR